MGFGFIFDNMVIFLTKHKCRKLKTKANAIYFQQSSEKRSYISTLFVRLVLLLTLNILIRNIAGEVPGPVTVTVTSQNADYLGKTQFTYVDQRKQIIEQIVSNKRKLADFFSEVAKQFKTEVGVENTSQTCQQSGELETKILKSFILVLKAVK